MIDSFKENYKILSTGACFAILYISLIIICFFIQKDSADISINIAIVITASSLGWLTGIGISPYDDNEKSNFHQIYGAISIFITGYAVAKIDPIITEILDKTKIDEISTIDGFRILLSISAFVLSVILTFVFRQYGRGNSITN